MVFFALRAKGTLTTTRALNSISQVSSFTPIGGISICFQGKCKNICTITYKTTVGKLNTLCIINQFNNTCQLWRIIIKILKGQPGSVGTTNHATPHFLKRCIESYRANKGFRIFKRVIINWKDTVSSL